MQRNVKGKRHRLLWRESRVEEIMKFNVAEEGKGRESHRSF